MTRNQLNQQAADIRQLARSHGLSIAEAANLYHQQAPVVRKDPSGDKGEFYRNSDIDHQGNLHY